MALPWLSSFQDDRQGPYHQEDENKVPNHWNERGHDPGPGPARAHPSRQWHYANQQEALNNHHRYQLHEQIQHHGPPPLRPAKRRNEEGQRYTGDLTAAR
jgi:hypothetical protein